MTSKTPSTSSSSVSYTSETATSTNKQMSEPPAGHERIAGDHENTHMPSSKNNAKFSRLCHNSKDKTKLQKQLFDHHHQNENLEDHEEALCFEKQNSSNKQHKRRKFINCIVIAIAMFIMAILATVLVAFLLSEKLPKQPNDNCGDSQIVNPRYSEFKLFGTKTSYSDAVRRAEFEKLKIFEAANRFNKQLIQHDDSHDQSSLSSIVGKYMQNVHSQMTKDKCELRQFHFYGRHASRYPSDDEIIQINDLMKSVKSRIDLTKFSPAQFPSSTPANISLSPPTSQSNSFLESPNNNVNDTSENNADSNHENKTVCANPVSEFAEWTSSLYPAQNDLILDSGYQEQDLIANRFKTLYPMMFDGEKSDITLRVTDKIRTVQTALPFLKSFNNYKYDICSPTEFPTNANDQANATIINRNSCYHKYIESHKLKDLRFYKECAALGFTSNNPDLHINEPPRTQQIALSISEVLKLDKNQRLNTSHVDAIYRVCKFETAQYGKSIWCRLFSVDDLKYLDYKEDIDDYFNQALYSRDLYESSCKLTSDVAAKMKSEMENSNPLNKPKAFYNFAHAETIQRLIATLARKQLIGDKRLSPSQANTYLNDQENIHYLSWRSSILSPFSANIALSLYQCPKHDFKMVVALNERPIVIDRCQDVICAVNPSIHRSQPDPYDGLSGSQCEYEDICEHHTKFL